MNGIPRPRYNLDVNNLTEKSMIDTTRKAPIENEKADAQVSIWRHKFNFSWKHSR